MSLLSFLEKIDLECKDFPKESILNYKALRLDGQGKQGLRGQLGLGDQHNCCDYLRPNNNKLILIEISESYCTVEKFAKGQRCSENYAAGSEN